MKRSFIDGLSERYSDILLDLDDTLYEERLYLFEAYKQIGVFVEAVHNISAQAIECYLIEGFIKSGRKGLFDSCINYFALPGSLIDKMLEILRTVSFEQPLELKGFVLPFISMLMDKGKRIFVITNGNVRQQQNKVKNIDWKKLDASINFVYANDFEPKPSRCVFDELNKNYVFKKAVYIGDSEVDREFALNCKIPFIDVCRLVKFNRLLTATK